MCSSDEPLVPSVLNEIAIAPQLTWDTSAGRNACARENDDVFGLARGEQVSYALQIDLPGWIEARTLSLHG